MTGTQNIRTRLSPEDCRRLVPALNKGESCGTQTVSMSAAAFLVWALQEELGRPIVLVADGPRSLDNMYDDLLAFSFGRDEHVLQMPALEGLVVSGGRLNADLAGHRLNSLLSLARPDKPRIVATCVQALMQKVPSPHFLAENTSELKLTQEVDVDRLVGALDSMGYAFGVEVSNKGQASLRGGLLDVWPVTQEWPVRLEFFGPVLESIRTFDPVEQRSVERIAAVTLPPAAEVLPPDSRKAEYADITAYLDSGTCFLWFEHEDIRHHAEIYEENLDPDEAGRVVKYSTICSRITKNFVGGQVFIGTETRPGVKFVPVGIEAAEPLPSMEGGTFEPDVMERLRRDYVASIVRRNGKATSVHIFCDSQGSLERLQEIYESDVVAGKRVRFHLAPLSEGFQYRDQKITVIAEPDLYGQRRIRRRLRERTYHTAAARRGIGERLAEWADMQPGELVVHVDHGIGKYLGMYEINLQGEEQEVLSVEYADKAKLYLPVSQSHLLSRYVGVGKRKPDLHVLGGTKWTRDKASAERSIRDLAAALIETQAARETLKGHAYSKDTAWQHEFEMTFPYEETEDQARAIGEVKEDMESASPMDRLVCGDVGYGKTEVAMRAAFKAVMDGKQVAILVPTTVLAQQHFNTFSERMGAFPVSIEMLSRFRTKKQQQDIVKKLNAGALDIVIGTHRLLQQDVIFKELGLVIIDEEQRFGVAHKERLKQLRQLVDVLTLTATPIPRTLYMSLTGAKDMSTIQTPPQERLPVETIVMPYKDEVVRNAILRELNREGQIFYLHNRVKTIHTVHAHLASLVPEARIGVAHGQMSERVLENVMRKFIGGEYDILLCTTIIESGVDIPNVNTILIDRADRFGMADLYQLRGRVGRYRHKAYAYLLLPKHGQLFAAARKRVRSLQRYSSLGSGFKVALRDLEIRGAGNILGAQQSGHIAAVGFDLYCQFLKRTVARMKGEEVSPVVDVDLKLDFIDHSTHSADAENAVVIPISYLEDENLRLNAYRKIAGLAREKEVDQLYEEFRDRYGPVPGGLDRLLKIARLKVVASEHRIRSIEVRGEKVMMTRDNDYLMRDRRFPRLRASSATERLDEIVELIRTWQGKSLAFGVI
ncbi:MAG: transcription-repair coupling factor [Verrucomicrobia bacterium]|nr:transcription-repair coupling factor [Verrucomicrobiota bacterium]